ncbi:MAG: argininosuccinate synthase [Campylobacterales bacterium]|nr:argininosuccinate synthase [Campylobacterales bacterium]
MKALALFSGGLDSMLAMKLATDQGIEVIALHVNIGFGPDKGKHALMRQRAKQVGATLEVYDARQTYLDEVLFSPLHGYGKHFNPCIDCHGFMFRLAKTLLPLYGAEFIITGEVVGQRPMSQHMRAIRTVTALAQDEDKLIVRPLCAKLLEETLPEKEGWIDRAQLLDISGRSRERQIALAQAHGLDDYEPPAGGCLLTHASFSNKIKDVLAHGEFTLEDIALLRHGRHLRLPGGAKLVIGRDEADNGALEELTHSKYDFIDLGELIGPAAWLEKCASTTDREFALRLVLSYAKTSPEISYTLSFNQTFFTLTPLPSRAVAQEYLIR